MASADATGATLDSHLDSQLPNGCVKMCTDTVPHRDFNCCNNNGNNVSESESGVKKEATSAVSVSEDFQSLSAVESGVSESVEGIGETMTKPTETVDDSVQLLASATAEINLAMSKFDVSADNSAAVVPSDIPAISSQSDDKDPQIQYVVYESEKQMEAIMQLITKDLSEPYSIYTYRYFIHNWPRLCFLAVDGDKYVGAIVCKLDRHKSCVRRGYIAMLAVDHNYRRLGIGSNLVIQAIRSMMDPVNGGCDEVVLETEISNGAALNLYEKLGFVRDKRLFRYYLNGVDALRLKLWLSGCWLK